MTYRKQGAEIFGFDAICATREVRISQKGTIVKNKTAFYFGDVYNSEYNVKGMVSVENKGARQVVLIKSAQGDGRIVLTRQ